MGSWVLEGFPGGPDQTGCQFNVTIRRLHGEKTVVRGAYSIDSYVIL